MLEDFYFFFSEIGSGAYPQGAAGQEGAAESDSLLVLNIGTKNPRRGPALRTIAITGGVYFATRLSQTPVTRNHYGTFLRLLAKGIGLDCERYLLTRNLENALLTLFH